MNNIEILLSNILIRNSGHKFYIFSNADGKMWVMPQKNMGMAMNLYQPCGVKGKLMKRFFSVFKDVELIKRWLGVSVCNYELTVSEKELLNTIFFKTKDIEFSVFCGTPSKHQKITMQISQGKKILGYCKFSDNDNVKKLFSHEQFVLDTLKEKGIRTVPECLYCGSLENDISVFIQSTIKTNHSKVLHQWSNLHWDFLTNLKDKTKQTLLFEQTDFFNSLKVLQHNLLNLSITERGVIGKAIDKVWNYYKNAIVTFSACQGDFTPWNMFKENKQLFVFDWEYAQLTYPAYLDYFHFFTQCCLFERHLQSENIYRIYTQQKQELFGYIKNPDFYYTCYLLDIISRYVNRDKGVFSKDMTNSITVWIKLIEKLTV